MHDELGNRLKNQYEDRTRYFLPRRTYTIIRIDGKAFHTFAKHCEKPFDKDLMALMDTTARALCKEIQGAKFAYVQSDEISILLTDFETIHTDAWFDGNIQKIVSVAASLATARFNEELQLLAESQSGTKDRFDLSARPAMFDARVFTIPDPTEVDNYFRWRQQDAVRNSIQMAARAAFTHSQCMGKNCDELQEMLFTAKNINWSEYSAGEKNGRVVIKEAYLAPMIHRKDGPPGNVARTRWVAQGAPIFTQDTAFLKTKIPVMSQED
jgi:tRNA(His) guanylyltransferase